MEEFLGKRYVLVSHENFEEYLRLIGKPYIARKAALTMRPEQSLIRNEDGTYNFTFVSKLATTVITFSLGEVFDEIKADGVKVKSIITIEDNKMIHVQTEENGRVSTHVREFFPDKMITTTTANGLDKKAMRYYKLVQ